MVCTIRNNRLQVKIRLLGGSLCSIMDNEGTEYLWQGDPAYWSDQAPNLFPYIARLTEGKYLLGGREYHMDIHGFVKDSMMSAAEQGEDYVRLTLADTEATRTQYPYHFRYEVTYSLRDDAAEILYRVRNLDDKIMYFGIGGHPGFRVPLEEGKVFDDYYLQFPAGTRMRRVNITPACFVGEGAEDFPLEEGDVLPLRHDLFDDDAIILQDIPKEVTLTAPNARKAVMVSFPQMNYLGLWHAPKTDAPYVCIEPWSSLPSRQDVVEDLAAQPGLVSLDSGGVYENLWKIRILSRQ